MFPGAAATLDGSVDTVKCMIWKKKVNWYKKELIALNKATTA